jgi:ArsR family transcriptional regulator
MEQAEQVAPGHVKVLHEAGLVDREKRGVWVYYRARPQALAAIGVLVGCAPL